MCSLAASEPEIQWPRVKGFLKALSVTTEQEFETLKKIYSIFLDQCPQELQQEYQEVCEEQEHLRGMSLELKKITFDLSKKTKHLPHQAWNMAKQKGYSSLPTVGARALTDEEQELVRRYAKEELKHIKNLPEPLEFQLHQEHLDACKRFLFDPQCIEKSEAQFERAHQRIQGLPPSRAALRRSVHERLRDSIISFKLSMPTLESEFRAHRRQWVKVRRRMETLRFRLGARYVRAARLRLVAGSDTPLEDPWGRHAAWRTLCEFRTASQTPKLFRAFDGVEETFKDVSELSPSAAAAAAATEATAETVHANGVRFSAAADFPQKLSTTLKNPVASLSSEGVLCVGDEHSATLHVADLVGGRRATIKKSNLMFGCVFEGTLFVSWRRSTQMHYAPVDDVLDGMALERFSSFKLAGQCHWIPHLDSARHGWIAACNEENRHYQVYIDLANRCSCKVLAGPLLETLGSCAGMPIPGVEWVASGSCAAQLISEAGHVLRLGPLRGNVISVICSSLVPDDPARALVYSGSTNYFHGERDSGRLFPERPANQSLLRLCGDIFLFFNESLKRWRFVRIIVP
eukprot:gnl/Chilomastix_cuspidata/1003.p1 GENE.gnl/Chilomastix_cuspidata/1003~~gnl/Chilomastix_cuspidata/1003.p1  ORF type:complete len:574 (+),score=140.80 gnl/Chilomastix_cuspidata/1003:48-1769(+)